MGFENVADGGQAPLTPPPAPPVVLVPPLPATLVVPPEPDALALAPARPGAPLAPVEFDEPPSALPAEPGLEPMLPAVPGEACPPTLLADPALFALPAALGVSAVAPLPQAPLASSGESTATRVRGFA